MFCESKLKVWVHVLYKKIHVFYVWSGKPKQVWIYVSKFTICVLMCVRMQIILVDSHVWG